MKHAEWRLRGIPAPLWRRVRSKAGDELQRVLLGLLNAYADGKIDPLSTTDPVATARGALGGQARASKLSPERRSEIARNARAARTDLRKPATADDAAPALRNCGECLDHFADVVALDATGKCPKCGTDYGPEPS